MRSLLRQYVRVARSDGGAFGRLWAGASVSLLGDGMTILALSWLVLSTGGTARLGLLGVCFTAPVIVGGLVTGPLLDRFDKRILIAGDSLIRAMCVASVPLAAVLGHVPEFLPFVVAVVYGLFRMVPMAGFPAAIPQLVRAADLDTANALESLSFSTASIVGPAAGGALVAAIGAPDVLLFDAASYLLFAAVMATIRRPLRPETAPGTPGAPGGAAAAPATARGATLRALARDRILVATTAAFMLFNVADGMLMLVVAPWLARTQLPGGAAALGGLTGTLAAGEIAGAAIAGLTAGDVSDHAAVRRIGLLQAAAALALLLILGKPRAVLAYAGFFAVGALTAPMTVWAQSMRMRRVPAAVHGRAFALLRTFMQATPPLGAAMAPALLAHGGLAGTLAVMAGVAGLPALLLIFPAEAPQLRAGPGAPA